MRCLSPHPYSPVFLGHHAGGTVDTHAAFSPCRRTLHEVFLWRLERETNICKFHLVWNASWSPWKCGSLFYRKCDIMSNKKKWKQAFDFRTWKIHRKFHLQLELGSGIQNSQKPLSLLTGLLNLSYMQKLAFNRAKEIPQSISVCGVWASAVCLLCRVTLHLLKPFLKHTEVQNPHPRQEGKKFKIISSSFLQKKILMPNNGFGVSIHRSFQPHQHFIIM